jgi:hypothetical protein
LDAFLADGFSVPSVTSAFGATFFARGAAAAPPRFRPLLSASFAGLKVLLAQRPWCLWFGFSVVAKGNRNVTKMSLLSISAALRCRSHTSSVLCRPTINKSCPDPKIVRIDRDVRFLRCLIGIGDAERMHFSIPFAARFFENRRIANAWLTSLPRIMSTTKRAFCADPLKYLHSLLLPS